MFVASSLWARCWFLLPTLVVLARRNLMESEDRSLDFGDELMAVDGSYCQKARDVLERNWQPSPQHTIPAYGLYPHQWSWDSAFIAIGYAAYDPVRARTELDTLFKAQWVNGLLPHIVFNPEVPIGSYFPDSEWWRSSDNSAGRAPHGIETSGIIQPPVHAIAALMTFRARPDDEGRSWLAEMFPSLCRWHDYFENERSLPQLGGLVWIRHPWESGMDNAPMWDDALAALTQVSGCPEVTSEPREWSETCQVPAFERQDLKHANPSMRPTNRTYNAFVYLLLKAREVNYQDTMMENFPFKVVDVLFNSILVKATRDLARIATILDRDSMAHGLRERADRLEAALEHLWDDGSEIYFDFDVVRNSQIVRVHVGGLMPLMLGPDRLDDNRRQRLTEVLMSSEFSLPENGGGLAVATTPTMSMDFDPSNYWRGPVWINTDWLLHQGLPFGSEAEQRLARSMRDAVVRNDGFYEYFSPLTGAAKGGSNFSWTAALFHDVFCKGWVTATS